MKNKKYLVIEEPILEKLLKEMDSKRSFAGYAYLKWLEGNIHALETVQQYCKPLDETIKQQYFQT